jgi:hypothetical protein
LIVNGTRDQTGIYQNAYGGNKGINVGTGLARSQTDRSSKSAEALPTTASKK